MDEGMTAVPVERIGIKPLARIGLVGAAAAAIVAAAILAAGAGAAPSGTLAAAGGTIGSAIVNTVQAGAGMQGGPDGPGFMGGRGGRMGGFRAITISGISGSSISLKTADGWTRTITVDSNTTYSSNGAASKLSDLKVGDEIQFKETRSTGGSFAINAIAVIPPHAGGIVTAVSGSTITITQRDGTTATITVTSATTYDVNGATGTLAGITVGMMVQASGTADASGALTATQVRAGTPGQMGPGHHGSPGDGDNDGPNGGPNGGAAPNSTPAPASGTSG